MQVIFLWSKFLKSPKIILTVLCAFLILAVSLPISFGSDTVMEVTAHPSSAKRDFIRYAEFNVPYEALETAMQADIDSYGSERHINWIEPLAYLGAKYGGNFSSYKKKDLASILEKLKNGENMDDLAKDMKYYPYYYQVYSAV